MLGVGSARGSCRRLALTLLLSTTGLAAACGGESSSVSSAGGMGGSAGRGAVGCPPTAPPALVHDDMCPAELPADGCNYLLECQSGPREFSYQCVYPNWTVSGDCEFPYDFCWRGDAQVRCADDSWQLMGWGGDPPPNCPQARPEEGSSCSFSIFSGPPTCGYPCPEGGAWSVGSCGAAAETSVWLYDGACGGS